MFMELKGKLPNKIIRRGLFRSNHFDESCCFLSHETDKVTQRDKVKIQIIKIQINNLKFLKIKIHYSKLS